MPKYPKKSRGNLCPVIWNIGVIFDVWYFYTSKKLCNKRKEENYSFILQYKQTYSNPLQINFLDNNLAVLELLSPPASNLFWPVNFSMDTCSLECKKRILVTWRKISETLVYKKSLNCESVDSPLLWSGEVYSVCVCVCVFVCMCIYIPDGVRSHPKRQ
jgi:hypothetical protein